MKISNVTNIIFILIAVSNMASMVIQGQHVQNSVVSCQDDKRKLLCLPNEYSKFDLPYRNDFNQIDIGKLYITLYLKVII